MSQNSHITNLMITSFIYNKVYALQSLYVSKKFIITEFITTEFITGINFSDRTRTGAFNLLWPYSTLYSQKILWYSPSQVLGRVVAWEGCRLWAFYICEISWIYLISNLKLRTRKDVLGVGYGAPASVLSKTVL